MYHALDAGLETQVKSSEVKSRKIFFHLRLERLQNSSGIGGGVGGGGVGGVGGVGTVGGDGSVEVPRRRKISCYNLDQLLT